MKKDLKAMFLAVAIFIGMLIVGLLIILVYFFLAEKYPVVDSVVRIISIVYCLVLSGYIFIRLRAKKKKQVE